MYLQNVNYKHIYGMNNWSLVPVHIIEPGTNTGRSHLRMTTLRLDVLFFSTYFCFFECYNLLPHWVADSNCCQAYAHFPATFFFLFHRQLNELHARSLLWAGKSMKVSFLALLQYLSQILMLGGTRKVFT